MKQRLRTQKKRNQKPRRINEIKTDKKVEQPDDAL